MPCALLCRFGPRERRYVDRVCQSAAVTVAVGLATFVASGVAWADGSEASPGTDSAQHDHPEPSRQSATAPSSAAGDHRRSGPETAYGKPNDRADGPPSAASDHHRSGPDTTYAKPNDRADGPDGKDEPADADSAASRSEPNAIGQSPTAGAKPPTEQIAAITAPGAVRSNNPRRSPITAATPRLIGDARRPNDADAATARSEPQPDVSRSNTASSADGDVKPSGPPQDTAPPTAAQPASASSGKAGPEQPAVARPRTALSVTAAPTMTPVPVADDLTHTPVSPVDPPLFDALLAYARRQDVRTVLRAPIQADSLQSIQPEEPTGTAQFRAAATPALFDSSYAVSGPAPDGTVIVTPSVPNAATSPPVFGVSAGPSYGFVTDNADGTLAYRPYGASQVAAAGGGPIEDSFTVTTDNLDGTVEQIPVTVPIAPNADPQGIHPTYTLGTSDASGAVSGATSVDAGVGVVSYRGTTTTSKGSVVVNPDGTFIYTPSADARQAAGAPNAAATGATTDTFPVYVVGESDRAVVMVTVPISPVEAPTSNAAQAGGYLVDQPAAAQVQAAVLSANTTIVKAAGPTAGGPVMQRHWDGRQLRIRPANATRPIRDAPPMVSSLSAPIAGPAPRPSDGPRAFVEQLLSSPAVISLQVTLFALAAMLLGGQAVMLGSSGLALPGKRLPTKIPYNIASAGSLSSSKLDAAASGQLSAGLGDRSRSWRWPGTRHVDAALYALPVKLARFSAVMARIAIDGSSIRAILGSGALLLPAIGLTLGVAALQSSGATSTPPGIAILLSVAVLGVFDAMAGFLAVAVFVVGVAVSGNLSSVAEVRTMLGLSVIWFAVPLIAGSARPLRRAAAQSAAEWRTWLGDLVIASLIGAWLIQKLIVALPSMAGRPLSVAAHANTAAFTILTVCALRVALEAVTARWYPLRLTQVQPATMPQPIPAQRVAGATLRTGVLLFIASAFLGVHWQLWLGGLLFLLPQLMSVFKERFPKSPHLHRMLPAASPDS